MAKVLATILLTTRAAALVYYGQELGMPTMPPTRIEDVQDPIGRIGWPKEKGRDGERMPMQWDRNRERRLHHRNALAARAQQQRDRQCRSRDRRPDSLLNWYRKLIALRRNNPALHTGGNIMLDHDAQNALVWLRKPANPSPENPAVVVACNLSAQPVTLSLKADVKANGVRGSFLRPLARTDNGMGAMDLDSVHLQPYGVYIGEVRF